MKNLARRAAPLVVTLVGTLLATGCNKIGGGGSVTPQTDDEKTLYAWGLMLGRNAQALSLTPHELEVVKAGLSDSVNKKTPAVELDKWGPKMDTLARNRQNARAEIEKGKSKGILEAAAKESGAQKLPAGTIIKSTRPGTGATPVETDRVKVHYAGRLADGTEFDSSIKRGEPAIFPLNGVIKCWTEGLQKMKVGGKATLTCPPATAYGDRGAAGVVPPNATLTFEVELLAIEK